MKNLIIAGSVFLAATRFLRHAFVYVAAVVLLVGATAKFFNPNAGVALGSHEITSPYVVLAIGTIECLLAWWLVRGWMPGAARIAGIAVFVLFGVIQTYAAFSEADSCGCFGSITVPPEWMIAVDTSIAVGLIVARPGTRSTGPPGRVELAGIALSIGIAWSIGVGQSGAEYHTFLGRGDPSTGIDIGRGMGVSWDTIPPKFPLAKFRFFQRIDPPGILSEGRWIVLFSRSSCDRCSKARQKFSRLPPSHSEWNFGIVDVADPGSSGNVATGTSGIVQFRLPGLDSDGPVTWVMRVPAILAVEDGRLKGVYYETDTVKNDLLRSSP